MTAPVVDETRPALTIVQFTDPHITAEGELLHGAVDTLAVLRAAMAAVTASRVPVAGVLLTGDLTNDGSAAAYRRLRDAVSPWAAELGAPVVYLPGNHDELAGFAAELGDPGDRVVDLGGLRVIALDSTRPGRHDGALTPAQLDWLAARLATRAPLGTVLALHHPPIGSPHPGVHLLRLRGADRLAAVLAGSDVRLVLSGHAHHTGCGALAGIPVWVSPALAYQVDTLPPAGQLRGLTGSAFTRVDLLAGGLVRDARPVGELVVTAVPVAAGEPVYRKDADEWVAHVRRLTPDDDTHLGDDPSGVTRTGG